ncbi:hypothetical protein Val02_86640 [Virgisporangium aliadipatigenens]|uniref:Aminoglycoside phosphotransferase domain-containing protein n=1 Tax=Virgisporangium aliadipatigenens TaxID=741659 RepID=A0A8J4DW23_9ACTN|nr:phosphotransferase [Virgisporangium aliadipatigenens]GIJ51778.1 hypothetical protein Val02_86640 [Virgisporangium aliadipatigenens]
MKGFEVEAARAAAGVAGPLGLPLAPPVAGVEGGRPVLVRVPGPRLDALLGTRPALAAAAGGVLASLHARPCPFDRPVRLGPAATEPIGFAVYLGLSAGQRRVLGALHRDAALDRAARAASRAALAGTAWCHGDARTDNFCVAARPDPRPDEGSAARPEDPRDGVPQLVDWEASGTGRPEVDLAALAASMIAGRLAAGTADDSDGPALRATVNRILRAARRDLTAVLDGYAAAGGVAPRTALLGALTGLALLTHAVTRPAVGPYDRATVLFTEIGGALLRHPGRLATLLAAPAGPPC